MISVIIMVLVTLKVPEFILHIDPYEKTINILIAEVVVGSLLLFSAIYLMFLRPLIREVETRRNLQKSLMEIEVSNRTLINALPDNILRLSKNGDLLDFKTGHWDSLHSINNMKIEDVLHSDIASMLRDYLGKTIETGAVQIFEADVPGSDDEMLHKECRMAKCDENSVVAVIRDITEQRHGENKLWYMSTHDTLTGLYNRNFFEGEIERISKGRDFPVSVIVMDIDKLKETNDLLGHVAGDRLIRDMAMILKNAFRANDIVARIGGDEFVVILPNSGSEDVKLAVERINRSLEKAREQDRSLTLEFSVGYATTDSKVTLSKAIKHADKMMYLNKSQKKQGLIRDVYQKFNNQLNTEEA